jgi:hypothetical protein
MSAPNLICVDPEKIFDFWPHAREMIKAAIDTDPLGDFPNVENQVLNGDQLLWLAWSGKIEAAATTRIFRGVCEVVAVGGHYRERWQPLLEKIEQYAKDEGAKSMRIYGRVGWQRVLKDYRVKQVIMEKAL